MSWTLAVMCELYRRDYLEIYDRRFWVKELNPKVQEIRRRLLDLKTTTRKPSQFHQHRLGTISKGSIQHVPQFRASGAMGFYKLEGHLLSGLGKPRLR